MFTMDELLNIEHYFCEKCSKLMYYCRRVNADGVNTASSNGWWIRLVKPTTLEVFTWPSGVPISHQFKCPYCDVLYEFDDEYKPVLI